MAVDYDTVIIGGTLQGRGAAAIAAGHGARVALVEPPRAVATGVYRQLLGRGLSPAPALDWSNFCAWLALVAEVSYPSLTLPQLAVQGVDVIEDTGQVSQDAPLTWVAGDRRLRTRSLILCPPTESVIPAIPGLAQAAYLRVEDLASLAALPEQLVILGRSALAISLAQGLAHRGTRVTLISRSDRLLPGEDTDISMFVETLLQAAGVNLRLGTQLLEVTGQQPLSLHLAGQETIFSQSLLVATSPRPDLSPFHLDRLAISLNSAYLPVNAYLKTSHPRVFGCGPGLGGDWAETTDHQDVEVAVSNALYFPHRRLQPHHRIGLLSSQPELARVGLTARAARHRYGKAVMVLQVPFSQTTAAHLNHDGPGFCRAIIHSDGRLLGAQICGAGAAELIYPAALLIQQNLGLAALRALSYQPHSQAEIWSALAAAWRQYRLQPGGWRRNWAETWFNWRRSQG
ncbi:MAG: FAD-dependent oxidoreductase [Cyanobacteria bacterium REEB459]|nr:FAD-dependent oxidoreductase [Cyanobacteria bacterium REEB459]